MRIKITTESPDTLQREALAFGIFSDERPPRGICGFVDWRLNGIISHGIAKGHIRGTFREKILIACPSRIPASKIILFGLGRSSEITYEKFRVMGYSLSEAMDGLRCQDYVLNFPTIGNCYLSVSGIAESVIMGSFDFLSQDIEKWATYTTGILIQESQIDDLIIGLQNFKKNTRDISIIELDAKPEMKGL